MVTTAVVRVDQRFKWTDASRARTVSVLNLVEQLVRLEDVQPEHQRQVLGEALWKWTEAPGMAPYAKYNIRYCSEGVVRAVRKGLEVSINHEHVHTRKAMIDSLLRRRAWTREELEEYFVDHGAACIVSVAEHALLGQSKRSGWERYTDVGIRVFDKSTMQWVGSDRLDTNSSDGGPAATPPGSNKIVAVAIAEYTKAQHLPALLSLDGRAHAEGAVTVLHQAASGTPTYFRVHDTVIEEPTRAVAYGNFRGNVDYALTEADVPAQLREHPSVVIRSNQARCRVRCELSVEGALQVAEALLALSLEKLRSAYS